MHRILDPATLGDHVDRLYRAAWALCGSREDAEDLVQDTYASVLARPRRLRNDDDLGYLLRTLRNTFLSQRRRRSLPTTGVPVDELEVAGGRTGEQPHAAVEAREVFRVISGLPDDFRDVIIAVDVAGLSYEEAARALRTRTGTIMSRLHRARARVAAELEGARKPPPGMPAPKTES